MNEQMEHESLPKTFLRIPKTNQRHNMPVILCGENDEENMAQMKEWLEQGGNKVFPAQNGQAILEAIKFSIPDLILIEAKLGTDDGYEICANLQDNKKTSFIPVIIISTSEHFQQDRAFSVGAADCIEKPLVKETFIDRVYSCLKTSRRWQQLRRVTDEFRKLDAAPLAEREFSSFTIFGEGSAEDAPRKISPADYVRFRKFVGGHFQISPAQQAKLNKLSSHEIYSFCQNLGISTGLLAKCIAVFLKLPYLENIAVEKIASGILPASFCRSNRIIAIRDLAEGDEISFVFSNPFHWELLEVLKGKNLTGQDGRYKILMTDPQKIAELFSHFPEDSVTEKSRARQSSLDTIEKKLQDIYPIDEIEEKFADETSQPLVQLVNKIIEDAYQAGASDIHIEPREKTIIIRYRIDGSLRIVRELRPTTLIRPITSRIKIMSELDIAERRLPQDGRIIFKKFSRKNYNFDLRVAIAPMNYGEKVVMRILDKDKSVMPLEQLGFAPHNLELYRQKIRTPYGMILHVGPTGSGKSMTLYAALHEIQSPEINIQTIEDPIEYTLPDINQLQTNASIGLDFPKALRSYLRQDPDVILVGEIRDSETSKIAVEAALTGHLLFSTLHTNDAPSTISRFLQMGVPPFMISSSLVIICAQRLLRRLCHKCREPYPPCERERKLINAENSTITLYRAKGCEACQNSGYKGRIGNHELLAPNDLLRDAITQPNITTEILRKIALESCGMKTLFQDAVAKVQEGICSLDDILSKVANH